MDPLYVVTPYFNPLRWAARLKQQLEYEKNIIGNANVKLVTIECAYGNRPFELPDNPEITRIQVRAKTVCWKKENLINIAISRVPAAKYIAWVDGDIIFRKDTWATETVHALQQYDIVQPWSDCYDLGPKDEHIQHHKSFCRQWHLGFPVVATRKNFWAFNGGPYDYPHCGYAWAATRQALEWLGGLIETAITGSGDHHMALALIGQAKASLPGGEISQGYQTPIYQWQSRALQHINMNIGFVWGTIEHLWHGRKVDRKYIDRWDIYIRNKFDPLTDIKKNTFGVIELAGNKPQLAKDIDNYLRSRNEDINSID